MRRAGVAVLAVAVLATAVLGVMLLARERGGPRHRDVTLAGDVPATFYLPDPPLDGAPAVVVAHGYSGDRATMSSLARSIALAGYGVLAIDFRGHGANPNAVEEGARTDDIE
ncbi:MAG TPA: alpha/beta hydrolase, partial [Actinomycetota bacterium]|nr:alpha/beta hydrolase [Actinomycetota bacterium]